MKFFQHLQSVDFRCRPGSKQLEDEQQFLVGRLGLVVEQGQMPHDLAMIVNQADAQVAFNAAFLGKQFPNILRVMTELDL